MEERTRTRTVRTVPVWRQNRCLRKRDVVGGGERWYDVYRTSSKAPPYEEVVSKHQRQNFPVLLFHFSLSLSPLSFLCRLKHKERPRMLVMRALGMILPSSESSLFLLPSRRRASLGESSRRKKVSFFTGAKSERESEARRPCKGRSSKGRQMGARRPLSRK